MSADRSRPEPDPAILSVTDASLRFGNRTLWTGLDLQVRAGEFVVVLGPNGAGKTSLLRAILGQVPLSSGSIELNGHPVRRGHPRIGYIPQQRLVDRATPLRARDLVALGRDGNRFGLPLPNRDTRRRVDQALADVGATHLANSPVATLSGGEQQRVRVGQALMSEPDLLLCDEPLSSLDLQHQRAVSELIDRSRRSRALGVLMITHDVNPVLDLVDRVVYLAAGQARVGAVGEVLTSGVLTELYQTPVEVLHVHGRIIVVGVPDDVQGHLDPHHHHDDDHDHDDGVLL